MSIQTLAELFLVAAGHDKPDCLLYKQEGRYVPVSTAELVGRVERLARALRKLGIQRGDRIALMADNGPDWPLVDFASLCIGAVLVPIYPTETAQDAAFISKDSGARMAFLEGRERLDALLALGEKVPDVEHFVLIEPGASSGESFTTLDALLEQGSDAEPGGLEAEARQARPEDLATFIYTSGTTGVKKGVMLTHGNITSNVLASLQMMDIEGSWTALSFLPLSHSFERTVDYIYFYRGITIAYAESVQTVAQNLQEVKPHVFVSVPRVYEKVQGRIYENVSQGSGLKQKLFHWAVSVGRRSVPYRLRDQKPPAMLGLKLAIADKLVFGKIRDRLGGRFEFAMSGGAPLSRDLAEFFWGAGIRIFEGYGLTETSPVLTVNAPGRVKLGTVGTVLPGVELRVAEDGEILVRGPNIMKGYYGNPEATSETIDDQGWLHTGDIGAIDAEGFLSITDRKKELIVNAYGKNIAPAPIENALKASRFISQVVVIGDQRKFLSALIVPDFESLRPWAESEKISFADDQELVQHTEVRALYEREIEPVNAKLARYERIHAWELLPNELTLETGELTPTQKVKRRIIDAKYKEVIDRLYQQAEGSG